MARTYLEGKRIAIIGGGPVGLVAARLLQMKGASVKVYERDADKDSRISGGTLDIHAEIGQPALREAGILESYYANSHAVTDRNYDMEGVLRREKVPIEETKFENPEIDRRDLRKIALDVLNPGTVLWGKQFTSLERKGETYLLHFSDDSTVETDIVIAADGTRSRVRPYVTDSEMKYSGTILIQGEILNPEIKAPGIAAMVNKGNLISTGEHHVLFIQTRKDGSLNYYISFRKPSDWFKESGLQISDLGQMTEFLNNEFKNWHPAFKELFTATHEFMVLPLSYVPVHTPWSSYENIALIGDAAHGMPPFAGVGVSIGLRDALHLSQNLTNEEFSSTRDAIKEYAEAMYQYASEAQADTAENEEEMHI